MKTAFFSEVMSLTAVLATAYGYLAGNYNFINIGVAISWVYISMFFIVVILSFIVLAVGGEDGKAKLKESFKSKGVFARIWSVLKTSALVIFLCLSSSVVTAVLLALIMFLMAAVRSSVNSK